MARRRKPDLSILSLVHERPGRIAALLDPFADFNAEVILAVDDRVPQDWIDGYRKIADRVLVVAYPGAFSYLYPWLISECGGRWIFHIDDDEVPSAPLAGEIATAIDSDDITHAWVARRWLWPDGRSFLRQLPWRSDFQPRLLRNDPAVLKVPTRPHQLLAPAGQRRLLQAPLWHAHLLLQSYDARVSRGEERERLNPGIVVAGNPINQAYYLPEHEPQPPATATLPGDEAAIVARYLDAGDQVDRRRRRAAAVSKFSAAQISSMTGTGQLAEGAYQARLRPMHEGTLDMPRGESCAIEVEVTNLGSETWPGGADVNPLIRLGAHWLEGDGRRPEASTRTFFDAPIAPGETTLVLMFVTAPKQPGPHRLDIDLVHENVRWFDASIVIDVEVGG